MLGASFGGPDFLHKNLDVRNLHNLKFLVTTTSLLERADPIRQA